jgi:hypothetical protein
MSTTNKPDQRTVNLIHFPNKDNSDPRQLDEYLDDPFADGSATIGAADTTPGVLDVYGGGAGEAGGKIRVYNNADDDGTVEFWEWVAEDGTGDFVAQTNGGTKLIVLGTGGEMSVPQGDLRIGQSDTTGGFVRVYGSTTGSDEGGEIQLYSAADHDGTYEFYRIDVFQDDLRIGRAGNTDITLKSDGSLRFHQYGAGKLTTDGSGNVTAEVDSSGWTAHADNPKATTSGSTVTFLSIPSGVEEIKLELDAVSYTSTTLPGVRLGDATTGGVLTSGYVAVAFNSGGEFASSTYIPLRRTSVAGSNVNRGIVIMHKTQGNKWHAVGSLVSNTSSLNHSWGQITLAGELDRVQVMNGTFDAGAVSLWYR